MPTVLSDQRDQPDRVHHVPIPPAAPTARLDPFAVAGTARPAGSAQRLRLPRPSRRADRSVRPTRRSDRVEHVPIPPAAPTARLDPFGCRRAPAAEELPLASAAE